MMRAVTFLVVVSTVAVACGTLAAQQPVVQPYPPTAFQQNAQPQSTYLRVAQQPFLAQPQTPTDYVQNAPGQGLPLFTQQYPELNYAQGTVPPSLSGWTNTPGQEPLFAHFELEGRAGDSGERLQGRLFAPLLYNDTELFFGDIRGQFNDMGGAEANFGLAYRRQFGEWIAGVYGFYDVKDSSNNNTFHQAAFGAELLSTRWDFRVNGYIPDRDAQLTGNATAAFSGGTIQVRAEEERAYYGMDAEVGGLLYAFGGPQHPRFDGELRAFAGVFHFDNDTAGFENLTGPRLRLELRMFDVNLLGINSRVTLAGQYEYDDVRGSNADAMLTVRIPFGRGYRNTGRLRRRMTDTIVRDIDIITNAAPGAPEAAIFVENGQRVGQVTVVDANTANPTATVAAAGNNSTVIVDGSKGRINTAIPVAAQTGQTLRGAGFQVRGANSGVAATFGSRPTVNGTDFNENVIITANNATIRDLNIIGGQIGIASDATATPTNVVAGLTITGNNVTGTAFGAFSFGAISGSDISGNTAHNNFGEGFSFDALSGGSISGNSATGQLVGFAFGTVSGGSISGNTATENSGAFLRSGGFSFAVVTGGTISGNTATRNSGAGTATSGFTFGTVSGGSISGNTATENELTAFSFNTVSGGSIRENTASGNDGAGFVFGGFNGNAVVDANKAIGNKLDGFEMLTMFDTGTFTNNIANNNILQGYDNTTDPNPGTGRTAANNSGAGNAGNNTFP